MGNETIKFDPTVLKSCGLPCRMCRFDGWGEAALLAGATDCGHDAEVVRTAFPRGATDAIALHSRLADQSMVDAFLTLS